MLLGDILIGQGLATPEDIDRAIERQAQAGGRLGDSLVALEIVTQEQLERVLHEAPASPRSIADTGISTGDLLNLLVKTMASGSYETPSRIAEVLRLPNPVVDALLAEAVSRQAVEILGTSADSALKSELRHALTEGGKRLAKEALAISQYVGAAPVTLEDYANRIGRQAIAHERITREQIDEAFANLVVADTFVKRLGPAINSGRSILLYGPPGNGKTSVAEKVGRIFNDVIYIPHCVTVEGQVIKVFDPSVHEEVGGGGGNKSVSVRREEFDRRWVPCKRPIVVTGGELTLEMLDLKYNPHARFYEAPLHVKALGGTFIIDDFGRQLVSPEEVLNRWIVPLQNRVDYLKLHTGKSFAIPFDELVIFSTNMEPDDLMDPAFLRRIPYKLETVGPNPQQFREIFQKVAEADGLTLDDETFRFVLEELTLRNNYQLACYQPRFICDQVTAACKYDGRPPAFSRELVAEALANLYVKKAGETPEPGPGMRMAAAE